MNHEGSQGFCRGGYDGTVVLEINTRRAVNRDEREAYLAEGLAFARLNLAAAAGSASGP